MSDRNAIRVEVFFDVVEVSSRFGEDVGDDEVVVGVGVCEERVGGEGSRSLGDCEARDWRERGK